MSEQPPRLPTGPVDRPNIFVSIILLLIGAVLLLPGLCSLLFSVMFFGNGSGFPDPMILLIWLTGFSIAAGGIALMARAIRRHRR